MPHSVVSLDNHELTEAVNFDSRPTVAVNLYDCRDFSQMLFFSVNIHEFLMAKITTWTLDGLSVIIWSPLGLLTDYA